MTIKTEWRVYTYAREAIKAHHWRNAVSESHAIDLAESLSKRYKNLEFEPALWRADTNTYLPLQIPESHHYKTFDSAQAGFFVVC